MKKERANKIARDSDAGVALGSDNPLGRGRRHATEPRADETPACASLTRCFPVVSVSAFRAGKKTLEQLARLSGTHPGAHAVFI